MVRILEEIEKEKVKFSEEYSFEIERLPKELPKKSSQFKSLSEVLNEDVDKILNLSSNEDNVDDLLDKMTSYKAQVVDLTNQIKGLKKLNKDKIDEMKKGKELELKELKIN
jgi:hypothetical protein